MGRSSVHIKPVLQDSWKSTSVQSWERTLSEVILGREGCLARWSRGHLFQSLFKLGMVSCKVKQTGCFDPLLLFKVRSLEDHWTGTSKETSHSTQTTGASHKFRYKLSHFMKRWKTSLPDSGPWFFRPMTVNADKSFNPDLLPRWIYIKKQFTGNPAKAPESSVTLPR